MLLTQRRSCRHPETKRKRWINCISEAENSWINLKYSCTKNDMFLLVLRTAKRFVPLNHEQESIWY
jgi:hypothetical protein